MKRIALMIIFYSFTCLTGVSAQTAFTGMRDITGLEIAREMAPGVNLWNSLDSNGFWESGLDTETMWGNPFTTIEMVTAIKERGFNTLRIPVTWYNHMGPAPDYAIDKEWMDRVEEVANYAFDNDMYVIINIHHDDYDGDNESGKWLTTTYARQEQVTDQLEKVWTQIATRFKDYGDYLLFETMNEPREVGSANEWNGGSAEHREVVNALNLAAVNAIRGTGGNNASRFIMVPQIGANVEAALEDMVIPNDDPNIIVSVHNYDPFFFTLADPGVSTWGTKTEKTELINKIKAVGDHFVKNGRAVVLGEWGAADKDNIEDRIVYYETFSKACRVAGITPIAWIYSFDRRTLTWKYPELEEIVLSAFDPNTIVLGSSENTSEIKTYPNPASNMITIELSASRSQIEIYTLTGQRLMELNTKKLQVKIDAGGFDSGIYILKVRLAGKTITRKLIVE